MTLSLVRTGRGDPQPVCQPSAFTPHSEAAEEPAVRRKRRCTAQGGGRGRSGHFPRLPAPLRVRRALRPRPPGHTLHSRQTRCAGRRLTGLPRAPRATPGSQPQLRSDGSVCSLLARRVAPGTPHAHAHAHGVTRAPSGTAMLSAGICTESHEDRVMGKSPQGPPLCKQGSGVLVGFRKYPELPLATVIKYCSDQGSFKMKIKYCNANDGVYQLAFWRRHQPLPYFFFLLSWTHRGQNLRREGRAPALGRAPRASGGPGPTSRSSGTRGRTHTQCAALPPENPPQRVALPSMFSGRQMQTDQHNRFQP